MKLESLKSDKFKAFEKNEILNKLSIIGGEPVETCLRGECDTRDYGTRTPGKTDGGGTPWDFKMTKCPSITADYSEL